jgi:predicted glycosyltransferase
MRYTILPRPGKSYLAKLSTLIRNVIFVLGFMRKNRIDLAISRVSPYVALAACVLGKPHLALADTESSGIYDTIFSRFVSAILTATSFQRTLRKDQIRFNANIELFYLHPNRFQPGKMSAACWA